MYESAIENVNGESSVPEEFLTLTYTGLAGASFPIVSFSLTIMTVTQRNSDAAPSNPSNMKSNSEW